MLRVVRVVGTREYLRVYWGEDCPNTYGLGRVGVHNAQRVLGVLPEVPPWDDENQVFPTLVSDTTPETVNKFPANAWPRKCDHCPAEVPANVDGGGNLRDGAATRMFCRAEHFDTPSGKAEPNDCWYTQFGPRHAPSFFCPWTNCDGKHLTIVLPTPGYIEGPSVNGLQWHPQHRASNCSMPQDTVHRCWVIAGEAPRLSSVEAPNRCGAGKCSTQIGDVFHKTLKDGEWV